MMALLAVAVGGGLGAASRYGVDQVVAKAWGTVVINVLGSFALGMIVGILYRDGQVPTDHTITYHLLGTGFCGGFTTFSTASLDALKIGRTNEPLNGGTYAIGMLIGAVVCAALGMAVGTLIS